MKDDMVRKMMAEELTEEDDRQLKKWIQSGYPHQLSGDFTSRVVERARLIRPWYLRESFWMIMGGSLSVVLFLMGALTIPMEVSQPVSIPDWARDVTIETGLLTQVFGILSIMLGLIWLDRAWLRHVVRS